jgi:plasmid stability protein
MSSPLGISTCNSECMRTLQIRNVPDDVHQALRAAARARGVSLQKLLLELVAEKAHAMQNRALLARIAARPRTGGLSREEILDALDAERSEREEHLYQLSLSRESETPRSE